MTEEREKSVSKSEASSEKKPARYVSPFDEMVQLFENGNWLTPFHFYRPSWPDIKPAFEGRTPKVDVIDRDKDVLIKAELPGVNKDDLDISVSDNSLTIKASTKHEEEKEEGEYHHRELSCGEFMRTLRLPANVDASDAVANFKDGLLELTLPKVEATKRRSIKVE